MGVQTMVKQRFEGKGTTLEEALDDLYQTAVQTAEEEHLVLPSSTELEAAGREYLVSVRELKRGYVDGKRENNLDCAFQSALQKAGIGEYNPAKHRVKVVGTYDLGRVTGQPAAVQQAAAQPEKGRPSGAAPSSQRCAVGVEDTDLY